MVSDKTTIMHSFAKLFGSAAKLGLIQLGLPYAINKINEVRQETEEKARDGIRQVITLVIAGVFLLIFLIFAFLGIFFAIASDWKYVTASVGCSGISLIIGIIIMLFAKGKQKTR